MKILIYLLLFGFSLSSMPLKANSYENPVEITFEQWLLFTDLMNFANYDNEFNAKAKNLNPEKYKAAGLKEKIKLDPEDADLMTEWLTKNDKPITYLQQILDDIENCPPPSDEKIATLCLSVRNPVEDLSADSIGFTYHKALWNLACATPRIDPAEVGRVKVRAYWDKYKKDIRCPETGQRASDDLNITKYAVDSVNSNFTRELAIVYKLDFNFVDAKDGLTLLDYIQKHLDYAKNLTPPPETIIRDYEAVYRAVVRAGGKHKKDLTPEELNQ